MEEPDWDYFNSIPWCARFLQDRNYVTTPTFSRQFKESTEDSLFAETLKTNNTIRAAISLYKRPAGGVQIDEVCMLLSLGSGMNGNPHMLHGGLIAALMDDAMGILLTLNKDLDNTPLTRSTVTANLSVSYLKLVPTPQIILVGAKIREVRGRKYYIDGWIEDSAGVVLTKAESLWIQMKEKL